MSHLPLPRRFLTREEAAQVANVSVDTIKAAINTGALKAKRAPHGHQKHLISLTALDEWYDQLEDA